MVKRESHYEWDPEKRRKAKAYSRVKLLSGAVNRIIVPVAFLLFFFILGGGELLRGFTGPLGAPLAIIVVLTLLNIVEFPLGFYSGYVYEHRYGLSRHTPGSWFRDYLKGLLIGYAFSVPVLWAVYFLMGFQYWWLWAAGLYFFVQVFMGTIYPVIIFPFFYKTKPFRNSRLNKKLLEMGRKAGVSLSSVEVGKESEKSVKANAFFAGMGRTRKIVLFDTLLDNFTEDEVETVIGHELGHCVHRDVWKGIALETVLLFPVFYVIHIVLSSAPGLEWVGDLAGLPLFLLAFDVLEALLMPMENWFSRRWEARADLFGLEMSRKPEAQISTEKRLADQALTDNSPHPLVEWWFYTHPSADRRIRMAGKWKPGKKS